MTYNEKYRLFYIFILLSIPLSFILAAVQGLWIWLLAAVIWSRVINFFGIHLGLHRYFSHNGYKTSRPKHYFLLAASVLSGHGSPISWASHHIHHHKHSDTDLDLHSPDQGFWHTVIFWAIRNPSYYSFDKQLAFCPKHLVREQSVVWVHKNYFAIWLTIMAAGSVLISWQFVFFFLVAAAGFSVFSANLTTNYLSHIKLPGSYRSYETTDSSYNNKWIQFIQVGEGLHNNHHRRPVDYNHAHSDNEWDPAAWVIDRWFAIKG